jgi:hypothetical protein
MTQKYIGIAILLLAILVLCASIMARNSLLIVIGLAFVPIGLMLSQRSASSGTDGDSNNAG